MINGDFIMFFENVRLNLRQAQAEREGILLKENTV